MSPPRKDEEMLGDFKRGQDELQSLDIENRIEPRNRQLYARQRDKRGDDAQCAGCDLVVLEKQEVGDGLTAGRMFVPVDVELRHSSILRNGAARRSIYRPAQSGD